MIEKYGLPLTDSDWAGLPIRIGQFGGIGRVEDLRADSDSVLLWSGGVSEVTIDSTCASDSVTRTTFTRRGGMVDLMPRGTTLHQVRWKGDASTCVSINVPAGTRQQLLGEDATGLNPDLGPQFGLLDEHAADLVRRLQNQVASGGPLGPAYVQGLSLTLAAYVSERYGTAEVALNLAGRTLPPHKRQELIAFVEDNVASNISLVDMSAVVGYSPDHFARLFKLSFGLSPHRYLISRRVERAKALLRQPTLSIAEVAAHCGFASQSHLNEVFRRVTGTTPGTYRRG